MSDHPVRPIRPVRPTRPIPVPGASPDNHPPATKKTRTVRKVWVVIAAATASLMLLAGAGGWWLTSRLQSNVTEIPLAAGVLRQGNELPDSFLSALRSTGDGKPVNILLLGSDTREGQGKKFGSVDKIAGARSDTAMIVHLAGDRKSATVLSIPRDLWTEIPACVLEDGTTTSPKADRFNVAFESGGPSCSVQTASAITGIQIDHVAVVNFKGFEKIVDTLNGVPVCLRKPIKDEKAQLSLPAGKVTLNGEQALGLARARYSLGDGSDLSRIQRQHRLATAFVAQAKKQDLMTNPGKLYDVLNDVTSNVTVDPGLSKLPAMASLVWQMRDVPPDQITYLTVPVVDREDGATVEIDKQKASAVFLSIATDTPTPVKSATTKPSKSTGAKKLSSAGCVNPIN